MTGDLGNWGGKKRGAMDDGIDRREKKRMGGNETTYWPAEERETKALKCFV